MSGPVTRGRGPSGRIADVCGEGFFDSVGGREDDVNSGGIVWVVSNCCLFSAESGERWGCYTSSVDGFGDEGLRMSY